MEDLLNKAKAALDANADGKVDLQEVADAAVGRVIETKDAILEAAQNVKEGFDANADGKVSADEIGAVAAAVVEAAEEKFDDLGDKLEAAADKVEDKFEAIVDKD